MEMTTLELLQWVLETFRILSKDAGEMFGAGGSDDEKDFVFEAPAIGSGLNLVTEPRKVEKIRVNFAKTAKVVDVKGLKDALWHEVKPLVKVFKHDRQLIPREPKKQTKRQRRNSWTFRICWKLCQRIFPNLLCKTCRFLSLSFVYCIWQTRRDCPSHKKQAISPNSKYLQLIENVKRMYFVFLINLKRFTTLWVRAIKKVRTSLFLPCEEVR